MEFPATIGIVGGGVVGKATARCFMEWAEVRIHDTLKERSTHDLGPTLACDLVFLCLPTPKSADNIKCDTSHVEDFCKTLYRLKPDGNYVLRSTVPIGFTLFAREKFGLENIVHSPEFLTARCANTDAQLPARNIIGDDGDWKDGESQHPVAKLYRKRFPGVPLLTMDSKESEAVKLFVNGFFAVKIAYFNEINAMADEIDLSWERILGGMLSDGRIAHSHVAVPGPDGKFGFGGECLPKDLANLVDCLGVHAAITVAAMKRNVLDRNRTC